MSNFIMCDVERGERKKNHTSGLISTHAYQLSKLIWGFSQVVQLLWFHEWCSYFWLVWLGSTQHLKENDTWYLSWNKKSSWLQTENIQFVPFSHRKCRPYPLQRGNYSSKLASTLASLASMLASLASMLASLASALASLATTLASLAHMLASLASQWLAHSHTSLASTLSSLASTLASLANTLISLASTLACWSNDHLNLHLDRDFA